MLGLRRRPMVILLVAAVAAYGAVVLLVWALQDRLVFAGSTFSSAAAPALLPDVTTDRLELPDGRHFRVAIGTPPTGPRGAAVVFVGNGEDLRSGVHWARLCVDYGLLAVAVEYPGYGASDGPSDKPSFFAAADAAAARARALAPGLPLCAIGSSLGSFCAVHLAAEGRADRLLLRAPPSTLLRAAGEHFPWLPVAWILRHDFDNEGLAPRVRCPTLIVHGDADDVVPLAHGERLRARCGGAVELIVVPGAGHNDLSIARSGPVGVRVEAFLAGR